MKCQVLIADDDQDIRDILAETLKDEGFAITTACNGIEALQSAAHHQPQVILLDQRMPGMKGLDVARCLLEQGVIAHIIIVSAAKDIREIALGLGCCFVSKPFDFSALLSHLSTACDGTDCRPQIKNPHSSG